MKFIPKRLVTAALQAAVATGGLVSQQALFAQHSDEGVARVKGSRVTPATCQGGACSTEGGYGTSGPIYDGSSSGYPGSCQQGYGCNQGCGNGCGPGCGCGMRHTGHVAHVLNFLNPGGGCSHSPDHGFNTPTKTPLWRQPVTYQKFWPNSWAGQPGEGGGPAPPMVYMPTDTTQLGYTYLQVPKWQPNLNMLPPVPRPADWHRMNPNCGRGGGGGCRSGNCQMGYVPGADQSGGYEVQGSPGYEGTPSYEGNVIQESPTMSPNTMMAPGSSEPMDSGANWKPSASSPIRMTPLEPSAPNSILPGEIKPIPAPMPEPAPLPPPAAPPPAAGPPKTAQMSGEMMKITPRGRRR